MVELGGGSYLEEGMRGCQEYGVSVCVLILVCPTFCWAKKYYNHHNLPTIGVCREWSVTVALARHSGEYSRTLGSLWITIPESDDEGGAERAEAEVRL